MGSRSSEAERPGGTGGCERCAGNHTHLQEWEVGTVPYSERVVTSGVSRHELKSSGTRRENDDEPYGS